MAARHITEVPPPGAAAVLEELRHGGKIGAIAKRLGVHHQTLKRLLIAHDAEGFAALQKQAPKPRPRPRKPEPVQPPPKPVSLADQVRKEVQSGWSLRQCAKKRQLSLKKLIDQLPADLVENADPGGAEKRLKQAQKAASGEALRLLQMDVEEAAILKRVPGITQKTLQKLAAHCEEDVLGSRWALKRIGPFTCEGTSAWIPNRTTPMKGVWMRCVCGHRQLRSPFGLSLGITACESCGRRC